VGHKVAAAESGRELVDQCRATRPDLVTTDIKMLDMDGIDAKDAAVPVILVSAHHDPATVRRAEADYVMAYLVKPIKQADLEPALEDRKTIEKAKGVLMKKAGLDEHDAFRRLQRLASAKHKKLVEIARIILTAEEAYGNS
jgi:response regulator NasT